MIFLNAARILVFSVAVLVLSLILDNYNVWDYSITDPLVNLAIGVTLASFLSYVSDERVQRSWKRLAVWLIPTMLVITYITPSDADNLLSGVTGREPVSIALSAIFFLVSLILIAYKSWKLRG